ncbi:MAG: hypothetical protein WBQ18_07085 [Solirubrobacteraceae bacterium]
MPDYIASTEPICRAGTAASRKLGEPPVDPTRPTAATLPRLVPYLSAQDKIIVTELTQLRALTQPVGGAAAATHAYDLLAASLTAMRAAIKAARARNLNQYRSSITAFAVTVQEANQAAVNAGLTVCGT